MQGQEDTISILIDLKAELSNVFCSSDKYKISILSCVLN